MYFSIFKKIFVHISFPFLIILSFFVEGGHLFRLFLICAFLHECTHLGAAILLGVKLYRLYMMPYGFELKLGSATLKYESLIIMAGPLASLFLCLLGYFFGLNEFSSVNLSILLINLLPALPLDGGRLLRLLLWYFLGLYRGNKIIRVFCVIIPILLSIYSIWNFSGWLITISLLILVTSTKSPELCSPMVFRKKCSVNKVKLFTVGKETKIGDLVKFFSPYYHTIFLVIETREFIFEKDIITYCSRFGLGGQLQDLCNYKS